MYLLRGLRVQLHRTERQQLLQILLGARLVLLEFFLRHLDGRLAGAFQ